MDVVKATSPLQVRLIETHTSNRSLRALSTQFFFEFSAAKYNRAVMFVELIRPPLRPHVKVKLGFPRNVVTDRV